VISVKRNFLVRLMLIRIKERMLVKNSINVMCVRKYLQRLLVSMNINKVIVEGTCMKVTNVVKDLHRMMT